MPSEDIRNAFTIVFPITIPPLGISTYFLQQGTSEKTFHSIQVESADIQNEHYGLEFDAQTGLLQTVTNFDLGRNLSLSQNLLWYKPSVGNDESAYASGGY